jgi:cysteinyl-tRNA synthetase
MKIYNSLSRSIENFEPLNPPHVGMYTCGMTVYDFAHIGHGRKYVGDDILRRILTRFGYDVTHVQNVTDVGHLVSDADTGEDKLEKGAKKQGKTVWDVAAEFTKHFYDSMDKLNVLRPTIICKATEHIPEQVKLVQTLMDNTIRFSAIRRLVKRKLRCVKKYRRVNIKKILPILHYGLNGSGVLRIT